MRCASFLIPVRQIGVQLAMLATICTSALAQQDEPMRAPAPVTAPAPVKTRLDSPSCAKPVYPQQSLREEQQGTVTLSFLIGVDGAVKASKIVKLSGFPLLDMAAQEGIGRCRFRPTLVDGKAEQAWMQMQYVWTLSDSTPAEAAAALARARAGAERGDPESQYQLGKIIIDPASPAHNQADALDWLRKAAEQRHLRAQLLLGTIMQAGLAGKADAEQAKAWYRKAAEQGMAEAQHALAMMLVIGARPEDRPAARDWLRRAAEQGYAPAQAQYGAILLQENTPESIGQAVDMLRKSAAQANHHGQFLLARCYATGLGVTRDDAEAVVWYEKAARSGNKQAQRMLVAIYESGRGVEADPVKAAKWRQIADTPRAKAR